MSTNATASTNGSTWYVSLAGKTRCTAAKRRRPRVTIPQNAVSVRDASVVDAPRSVMSSCDQLPLIVSQIP